MNNYPIWWDTTITIFNRFEDTQTHVIQWFKKTISGVFWKEVGNKVTVNDTVLETNNIICRIPKNDIFLEKYVWVQMPNDKMSDYFTLGKGDIIIKGTVTDTINEYQAGYRSNDIIAKYKELQGCMNIEKVAINVGAGRTEEHYLVQGI